MVKFNVSNYWEKRYKKFMGTDHKKYNKGYGSGYGSQGVELKFKVNIVKEIILKYGIKTICDYGCGSGNFILNLPDIYDKYLAFDVSESAINLCKERVNNKKILFTSHLSDCPAESDLAISLDVIFHLIGNEDLLSYLDQIFRHKYVVVYTTDYYEEYRKSHVIRRNNSKIIMERYPNYLLLDRIPYTENDDRKEMLVYKRED